jgi:hypothetical protein
MNRVGLPRHSLSTVMRSYLLEHEIALGTKQLEFEGGTAHSMRHAFVNSKAADMIVVRRSLCGWLLRRSARWIFPDNNFVRTALLDKELQWRPW